MSRFLMIDIGAGTMDILFYDAGQFNHYKAVAPSPVRLVADRIRATRGGLLVDGSEMGGGPVTQALIERAATAPVIISRSASATLHHDPRRVAAWGLRVAEDNELAAHASDPNLTKVSLGDVEARRIAQIIEGLGLPLEFDIVALCAQDHGVAPAGVSHLDYRHNLYAGYLAENPRPESLLFRADEVPAAFNRLRCMAREAQQLNAEEVYVMDSGMAAILGASRDPQVDPRRPAVVLDIATSHTVGAAVTGDDLAGFFEYHTQDITLARLENLLRDLCAGSLDHARVLAEGGHGAFVRHAVGPVALETVIATGPKRRLLSGSSLPVRWGAPWGDNMMTGTVGLLEAVRRRKGLGEIVYL